WCQGNLQHLRLLFADGIRPGHRAIMAMGVVAYASALLWAVFLVLSTLAVAEKWLTLPVYFTARHTLFPLWPQWRPELALALAGSVPVSVCSSRVALGRAFRRRRLFITPEETRRPELLTQVAAALDRPREPRPIATAAG